MLRAVSDRPSRLRALLLAGVAALALSACASNRTTMRSPDFSGLSTAESQSTLGELSGRYQKQPKDKVTIIYYSAALAGEAVRLHPFALRRGQLLGQPGALPNENERERFGDGHVRKSEAEGGGARSFTRSSGALQRAALTRC